MSMEWQLEASGWHVPGRKKIVCDPEQNIRAAGDSNMPILEVSCWLEDSSEARRPTPLLISGSLHRPGNNGNDPPRCRSGWDLALYPVRFQLSSAEIEYLTAAARNDPEGRISLWLRFGVLLSTTATEREQPGYPEVMSYFTQPRPVWIHAPRWQTFLKIWGYPESRLVPLTLRLPEPLQINIPVAQEHWVVAVDALASALDAQRRGDWIGAGAALRGAAEHALYTWCSIWGKDEPGAEKSAGQALTFLDGVIPKCNMESGSWPRPGDSADHHRICIRYTTLRSLYKASHSPHHVGKRPVYTQEDIDYLVTSLVATLRALPAFWMEYPKPPEGKRRTQKTSDAGAAAHG